MTWKWIGVFVPCVAACGTTIVVGEKGPDDDATTASSGAGGAATGPGVGGTPAPNGGGGSVGPVDAFCADACQTTADAGCFDPKVCLEICQERARAWSNGTREAFAHCAAEDPLCFITLEGCMLAQINAEAPPRHELFGVDFDAYEGDVVHVAVDGTDIVDSAVITGGAFSFSFESPPTFDQNGPRVLVYLDGDGNGVCDSATDHPMYEGLVWNGSFDDVVYSLTLSPATETKDWVCNSI